MNSILKDKIRMVKEDIKVLDLKKESLTDKVQMQENFIEELENQAAQNIESKKKKVTELLTETDVYMNQNSILEKGIQRQTKDQENFIGATDKLRKLGNLKGKISQKVSTITKEHKFFTENTVCPTCNQEIEETLRINRINDAQTKAKK